MAPAKELPIVPFASASLWEQWLAENHAQPDGIWSPSNIERVARLTAAGRMQPAGLAQVEAAQQDGRWQAAYDPPKAAT